MIMKYFFQPDSNIVNEEQGVGRNASQGLPVHVIRSGSTFQNLAAYTRVFLSNTILLLHKPFSIREPRSISVFWVLIMLISLIRFFSHALSLENIPGGMDLRQRSKCLNQPPSTGSRSLQTVSPLPRSLQDLVSISAISDHHPRNCRREAGDRPLRRAATQSRLSDSEVHPGAIHKGTRIPFKEQCSSRFTTTHSHIVSSISHLTSPLTSCSLIHG